MNKLYWVILGLVVIVVGVILGYVFGYDRGSEQPIDNGMNNEQVSQEEATTFYSGGVITRNDSHASEPWYLDYTQGDQKLRIRLAFSNEALCTRKQVTSSCNDFELRPNEIVNVNGQKMSDYVVVDTLHVTVEQPVPSASDTFKESADYGFYGTITLTGYMDVVTRVCNPGGMCGSTVEYASFVYGETTNEALKKFTGTNDGNSFVAGDRVGIGCQQKDKNRVYYENDADSGYITGEISGTDYAKLITSTKDKPIQFKMTREIYTSGRGAPDCYSHFRNFDVL